MGIHAAPGRTAGAPSTLSALSLLHTLAFGLLLLALRAEKTRGHRRAAFGELSACRKRRLACRRIKHLVCLPENSAAQLVAGKQKTCNGRRGNNRAKSRLGSS
jgi:hypothetical protein